MMSEHLDGMCDAIDAGVYSGDTFVSDEEACVQLEEYMGRWQREIERIRAAREVVFELAPCPFCGKDVEVSTRLGSCLEISCCVNMELQKSNVLSIAERETWNTETYQYAPDVEAKALAALAKMWNTRAVIP